MQNPDLLYVPPQDHNVIEYIIAGQHESTPDQSTPAEVLRAQMGLDPEEKEFLRSRDIPFKPVYLSDLPSEETFKKIQFY